MLHRKWETFVSFSHFLAKSAKSISCSWDLHTFTIVKCDDLDISNECGLIVPYNFSLSLIRFACQRDCYIWWNWLNQIEGQQRALLCARWLHHRCVFMRCVNVHGVTIPLSAALTYTIWLVLLSTVLVFIFICVQSSKDVPLTQAHCQFLNDSANRLNRPNLRTQCWNEKGKNNNKETNPAFLFSYIFFSAYA